MFTTYHQEKEHYVVLDGNHRLYWFKELYVKYTSFLTFRGIDSAQCAILKATGPRLGPMSLQTFAVFSSAENLLQTEAVTKVTVLEKLLHVCSHIGSFTKPRAGMHHTPSD